ncbi:MAG: hypothetical protein KBC84_02955 [Proteobacteria bacterium]|nr:hypothetical protein [Pseudomonadota bacterium]
MRNLYSELKYFVFNLKSYHQLINQLSFSRFNSQDKVLLRAQIRKKYVLASGVYLRELLISNPLWVRGHLLLGLNAIEQTHYDDRIKDPRVIGTIRISAEAVLSLIKIGKPKHEDSPCITLVKYISGSVLFFQKKYEEAEVEFRGICKKEKLNHIPQQLSSDICERYALILKALNKEPLVIY